MPSDSSSGGSISDFLEMLLGNPWLLDGRPAVFENSGLAPAEPELSLLSIPFTIMLTSPSISSPLDSSESLSDMTYLVFLTAARACLAGGSEALRDSTCF